MFRYALILASVLFISGCSSISEMNPLSALGLGGSSKQAIDYSARPPLAIPPPEQRGQLSPPQDGQAQAQAYSVPPQAQQNSPAAIAPPPQGYSENTPGAVVEEKSWLERNLGI